MRTGLPAALAVALLAAAVSLPAAAEAKIAVVNMGALMRDAPQVQTARAKFTAEFQKREDELKAEVKKVNDDDKRFQREGDTMSAQQRATTAKDLYTRKTDLDLKQRQFAEQAQARNAELERQILETFGKAIEAVAREKGLDLVLRDAAFFSPGMDITPDVIAKLSSMPDAAPAESKKKKK
jgi:outer membrane protein